MQQDRAPKKTKRRLGNNDSTAGTIDIIDQVPEIEDVLAEVDAALRKAEQIHEAIQPRDVCGC